MNTILRNIVLAAAATAATVAPLASADAEPWHHHHHGRGAETAIAAGLAGVVVGALIAGSDNPARVDNRRYYDDGDRYYIDPPRHRPHVVTYEDDYYGAPRFEPWTRAWFRYCEDRYRTFDPERGTFRGNDGRDHFCVAG